MTGCLNRSRRCAVKGCPDPACVEANRRYNRRNAKLVRMGRGYTVDAQPVREHVRCLMAAGMGYRRIAAVAGMSHQGVQRIIGSGCDPAARVKRTTADRLMAVGFDPDPVIATVDASGCRRRLQALVRIGWTQSVLARELGMSEPDVARLMRRMDRVRRSTAQHVAGVYERLCMTPQIGPSAARSRARGGRLGWPSPLAWEGSDIDDPTANPDTGHRARSSDGPDPVEVAELVAGRKPADWASKASRAVAYGRLFDSGMSKADVAAHLRVSGRTAERARARWLAEQAGRQGQEEAS